MFKIDLNSDLGEGFGIYKTSNDEEIMKNVTSVNIACGFHAGDPTIMKRSVELATKYNVAIGAHPGLPDLLGFGRREMKITPEEARDYVIYQVGALMAFVRAYGSTLHHVKPHGALYNMAARNYELAFAIAEAVKEVDKNIILVGLAGSQLIKAAEKIGIKAANEVFADRAYLSNGELAPRKMEGAIINDVEEISQRALRMIKTGEIVSIDGSIIKVKADTICVHSDTPHALHIVKELRKTLSLNGVKIEKTSR
jgi:UPF0271 protein